MSETKVFAFSTKKNVVQIVGSFEIGDESFDVRALKDAHIVYLMAEINDVSDGMKIVAKVLDFTAKALTKESALRFRALVLDPEAGLEISEIMEVFNHIVTVVAAGPTVEKPKTAPRRSAAKTL